MNFNIKLFGEVFATVSAHHSLDPQVVLQVSVQAATLGELLWTPSALVRLFTSVVAKVLEEVLGSLKGTTTGFAFSFVKTLE